MYGKQTKPFYHGSHVPLTYKFNPKKTPAVPGNAYKREKNHFS